MNRELLKQMAKSPAKFRAHLLVDTDEGPQRLGDVMDSWQRDDFEAADSGWLRVARVTDADEINRIYLERPRGHSKTSDLAVSVLWVLAFSRHQLAGVAAACDREQARLLLKACDRLLRLNEWLASALEVQSNKVSHLSNGSELTVLSADAAVAFGRTPDFTICDELTHWPSQELWEAVFSAAAKRAHSMLLIISNAGGGMGSSWQWTVREEARTSERWHFSRLEGPQASWITPDRLEEQKRLLPRISYQRLWLNEWTVGSGDALSEEEIDAAFADRLQPMASAERGYSYGCGLDLGLTKDACVFAIVARDNRTGVMRLAKLRAWKPRETRRVDLAEVETAIRDDYKAFHWAKAYADPWQGHYLLQRLEKSSIPFETYAFTVPSMDRMARHFVNSFSEQNIRCFEHQRLRTELSQTMIVERGEGKLRLKHPRDGEGHGDHAVAFSLALLAANDAGSAPAPMFRPRIVGGPNTLHAEVTREDGSTYTTRLPRPEG
ncbi:Phage Terminase [Planctomycetes bacterium Pan216]|uniref:Phage Terminase n=1 Tax=Kolteria novifilia TaxID=2527975 RepID=A0A518B1B2_9BACT|nr:Phage Terminase [Planctomycetes bacterium Pan216]